MTIEDRQPFSRPAVVCDLPFNDIKRRENALVAPFQRGTKQGKIWPSGVYDADGQPSPHAHMRILTRAAEPLPEVFEREKTTPRTLPGRWLFCGLGSVQFGHMISRGMGRLWALDRLPADTQLLFSSIFMPDKQHRFLGPFLKALGLPHHHFILRKSARVEELFLAPDLFGEHLRGVATPAYVEWLRARVPQPGSTGRKIYLTRTRLNPTLGRLLCEDKLEANMAAAGFEIVAPEALVLEEQFAMYAQADVVVAAEGSSLHIAPFAMRDDAQLVIIKRRPEVPELIANQIASFCRANCAYVDAISCLHWPEERADNLSMAELNFEVLRGDLLDLGVIAPGDPWHMPGPDEIIASRAMGRPAGAVFLSDAERDIFLKDLRAQRRKQIR